jgi:histidinol phosphatase-like enzyme
MWARRRGVFLDLNGTLVEPLKPERLDEITLIPGVVGAVALLSAAGFVWPVVTVQSRIAKGLFSLPEFEIWFANFAPSLQMQGPSLSDRMSALIALPTRVLARNRIPYFTIVRQLNINLSWQIVL